MRTFSTLLAALAMSAAPISNAADAEDFATALVNATPLKAGYAESLQATGVTPLSLNELG